MKLPDTIAIKGYKCFEDVIIPLGNKITCLVGKNNSGKTSVIEILKLLTNSFDYPSKEGFSDSKIDINLISKNMNFSINLRFNLENPQEMLSSLYKDILSHNVPNNTLAVKFFKEFQNPNMILDYEILYRKQSNSLFLNSITLNSNLIFQHGMYKQNTMYMPWNTNSHFPFVTSFSGERATLTFANSPLADLGKVLSNFIRGISFISVDRYVPTSVSDYNENNSNENLSETAKLLRVWSSSKKSKFNLIVKFLNGLDDSIGDLRFEPIRQTQVMKFAKDSDQESADISLENCGAGVKQLLGMATFILNDDSEKFIIIDEPQAFLHPHAEELFVELINQTKHKFLIATHSPVFINAALDGIVLLKKQNGKSTVVQNSKGQGIFKSIALELGTSAHQLVVGKGILFLEGETEVSILKKLISRDPDLKKLVHNYLIRPIPATGMIFGKGKTVTRDLLKDIQEATGLGTIIVVDKDKKIDDDLNGRVIFADFNEIEELFITSKDLLNIITLVSSEKEVFNEISQQSIEALTSGSDSASKKLNKIFNHFFKEEYDKVKHGSFIATKIYESNPEQMNPFIQKVRAAIGLLENR